MSSVPHTDSGRDRWHGRTAFILAAIGSAVGLGNVWRFPYVCYKYGGGAFLLAYMIALLTAGIPLLILEFGLGHKFQAAAPGAMGKVKRNYEFLGWWAVGIGFVIVSYYAVVMGWCFNYLKYAFSLSWGEDTNGFFYNSFLGLSEGHFEPGGIRTTLLAGLALTWIAIVLSIWKGAKTVSKVVYITVVIPWFILVGFVIRGVTLPGASTGLAYYLTPDFSALLNPEVWIAAYTQVFFSISIGFGIMIAYASFLPKRSDIVNNAFIIGLADALTAFLGGLAVFGTLGYYATETGKDITEVVAAGPGLAFVTYPTMINLLPGAKSLFGILFFLMLLTLGIDSAFSLVEAVSASVRDKWGISHKKANISVALLGILFGLVFTTGAGLLWLDIVDHFMNNFGLCIIVLLECFFIGHLFGAEKLRDYVNSTSEIHVGRWWNFCVKYFTPILLLVLLLSNTWERIKEPYEGYPRLAEFLGGWLPVLLLPIVAIIFMKMRRSSGRPRDQ